jgi:predicted esterase
MSERAPADPHGSQPLVTAGMPVGQSRAVAVMVHGRNAAPRDILTLVPQLGRPAMSYVAPAAANNTWYPYSFLTDMSKNEPGLSSGLSTLDRIVKDLVSRGVAKHRIVLLGFSQGACLSAEYAVRHADRFGGVVVFSGGLIGPPGTTWNYPGAFNGTPVFLGCSDVDAHVPKARVEESAGVFDRMGARVTTRLYPGMGHLVNQDEIAFAQSIFDQALGPGR